MVSVDAELRMVMVSLSALLLFVDEVPVVQGLDVQADVVAEG